MSCNTAEALVARIFESKEGDEWSRLVAETKARAAAFAETPEGKAREAKISAERLESDRRDAHEKRLKLLKWSNVPARHQEALLTGTLDDTAALLAVKSFLDSKAEALILTGGKGVGKSVAAAYAAFEARGRFITAAAMSRVIFADEGRELETEKLLVIDDLGVEYLAQNGAFLSFFDALFDARYAAKLRTIITSNLKPDDLRIRYGDRFWDRLVETGRVVTLNAKSLRSPQERGR